MIPTILPLEEGEQAGWPGIAIIADDHEMPRAAMTAILQQKFGIRTVLEASTLDEAVTALDAHDNVCLAIFDLMMPGMDGPSSLRAVKEVYPGVPLVVFSASNDRRDMLAALTAGAHGYVPKQFRMGDIEAAIRSVLEGHIYVPASIAVLDASKLEEDLITARSTMLSARQRDVLRYLRKGLSNKAIARELSLGEGTVKVHMAALFRILGVTSRAGAVAATTDTDGRSEV